VGRKVLSDLITDKIKFNFKFQYNAINILKHCEEFYCEEYLFDL